MARARDEEPSMSVTDTNAPAPPPADARQRVTIITVSYNSAAVLPDLLATVPGGTRVVVVDNGGEDDTQAVAARSGASLVRLDRNLGFGRGCNAGAASAGTEFLFFVNPDATLEPGCVEALVRAADAHPHASAFNPRIVNPSGRVEYKRRSILLPATETIGRGVPHTVTAMPALAGGALFCRREAFASVGGFDPAIFLYHEDDDLAIRLRRGHGPVMFVPDATVRHRAGHSSGRSAAVARFKGYHMARSRIYALAKHGRPAPWTRTFASAILALAMPQNLLSKRRRGKHWGQVEGALSAWRDGGRFDEP